MKLAQERIKIITVSFFTGLIGEMNNSNILPPFSLLSLKGAELATLGITAL